MSVVVTMANLLTTRETLSPSLNPSLLPGYNVVRHGEFDVSQTLNAQSIPPAQQIASFTLQLVSGSYTIDLTNLPGTNGDPVNASNQQIQCLRVNCTGNAQMTFAPPGVNGYPLFGNTGNSFNPLTFPHNFSVQFSATGNTSLPDISPTAKLINVSGTGNDVAQVTIITG
jgi:hypothetical protein